MLYGLGKAEPHTAEQAHITAVRTVFMHVDPRRCEAE